ncbi:unnamed protein product, partial [Rotaria sp. Silwood2]
DPLSPESLIQNINSELQSRSKILIEQELHSALIRVYFNNLLLLKNSFVQIESLYSEICQNFRERFEKLIEPANELISTNEFDKIADLILQISKCVPILNKHLQGLIEEKYQYVVQSLLQYLSNFVEKAGTYLIKPRLNENEIDIVKNSVKILGTAKENAALQDRISTYIDMLRKKNERSVENIKNVSEIYNLLIEKIVNYFNQINNCISKLFEVHGDRALEDTESLINDMDAIRTIPEIDSKTAGTYYRTVDFIRGHMNQVQREVQDLLISIESQSETPNYTKIARLLSRIKNAKWMNRVSPGAYDVSITRITDELTQYFHQLEERLMKLDLSMKHPENISIAQEIFDKLDSLSVLERSVPELKSSKDEMIQRFLKSIQSNFDRMQTKFQLQDINVYQMKQELIQLEQMKRDYEDLHPANVFLRQNDFSDINKLNHEMKDLENKRDIELAHQNEKKSQVELELNSLKSSISSEIDQKIDEEKIVEIEQRLAIQSEIIQDLQSKHKNALAPFQSIKDRYESLIATHNSITNEQMKYFQDKTYDSIESLNDKINQKKKTINECQKNKPTYNFDNEVDAATADIALLYTSNCEKIANIRFKEMAADIHAILVKYITEYGIFLNREIDQSFKHITTIHSQEDLSQYSEDLETRLEQLTSLSEYKHVFEYIDGSRKVEFWRRKFHEQYRTILGQIENHKVSGRYNELHEKLNIVQGLIRVDHFCGGGFLTVGFGALYNDYQIESTKKSKETYHVVLESIMREDYAATESAMIDIDKKTASPRDIAQIEQKLQFTLNSLMKKTEKLAHSLDLNNDFKTITESQIQAINANTDKIRTASVKPKIMTMIDEKMKLDLTEFEKKITACLSKVLFQAISTIENFMETNDVLEAELNTEKLLLLRRELDSHFNIESVSVKINEIKQRLDSLDAHLLKKCDLKNIQQYPVHSPKDLVVKLQKAAEHHSAKYKRVETYISAEIRRNFQAAIETTRTAPIEKRLELIDPLYYALDFLPDDLQTSFRKDISDLKDRFLEERRAYQRELEGFLRSDNVNDTTIKKMNELAIKYDHEKQDELLTILHLGVLTKLETHWKIVQAAFQKDNVSSAIQSMRDIINYHIHAPLIPSTEQYYKFACDLIGKSVLSYSDTLSNIFAIQQIEAVDQAFTSLTLCIEFSQSYPEKINDFISQKVFQTIITKLETMYQNWQDTVNDFNVALKELNIGALHSLVEMTDRCDRVLQNIRNSNFEHSSIKDFIQKMKEIPVHSKLISIFQKRISELAQIFTEKLISDKTIRFEAERDQFFSNLLTTLKTFKLINIEFPKIFSSFVDLEQIEKGLKIKIEEIKRKLLAYATQTDISQAEADEF